jgi:DNA (cytosine-5)-methyltransferase 1
MAAYYNEFDPFAAAWLRELIKAGLIADGEVDERSIADVRPDDLRGFVQCHFFAGIGGWSYALRLAGWPDDRPVWTGSCPCQPWSVAGQNQGADDSRDLWPTWFSLIGELQPPVIFGEQVFAPDALLWIDRASEELERHSFAIGSLVLPAVAVGAPHARDRFYFVADRCFSDSGREPQTLREASELTRNWTPLGVCELGMAARVRLATWMMGFHNGWLKASCAGLATPSSRKSRKSSSKPTSTVKGAKNDH